MRRGTDPSWILTIVRDTLSIQHDQSPSEIDLRPDTVLQIVPGVRTRWDAGGHVLVDSAVGTIVDIGPHGFELLDRFARPITLHEAVARLEVDRGGSTTFAPTMNVINMLIEEGVLAEPATDRAPTSGWADPIEHARMLHDHRRTGDYLTAVAAAVQPGDVVVDVGTGSGVLAVAAARAGARRVYAVEASDIASIAAEVFEANRVSDRITLVPGWSRQIELPERADVLVAEVIGNEPFEEEILETTLDARKRLLKPDARLVPHGLTLMARPIRLPDSEIRQRVFGSTSVDRWRELYDIDFQPLLDAATPGPVHTLTEGEVVATWPEVGRTVPLASVDLTSFDTPSVHASAHLTIAPPGIVNAIAVTFRAALHGAFAHTLDPWRWPASSWATSVWVLPDELHVGPGSRLRVEYRRRVAGAADGMACEVVDRASR